MPKRRNLITPAFPSAPSSGAVQLGNELGSLTQELEREMAKVPGSPRRSGLDLASLAAEERAVIRAENERARDLLVKRDPKTSNEELMATIDEELAYSRGVLHERDQRDLEQRAESLRSKMYGIDASVNVLSCWKDPKAAMVMGVHVWENTLKIGQPLDAFCRAEANRQLALASEDVAKFTGHERLEAQLRWLGSWAHFAFPRIETSHTYAAALMCTDVYVESLEDLEIQWRAFEVIVPTGLLQVGEHYKDKAILHVTRIRVTTTEDETTIMGCTEMGFPLFRVTKSGACLADVLTSDAVLEDIGDRASDAERDELDPYIERLLKLSQRLVAGLLLAMQHTTNFKSRLVGGKHAKGEKRSDPEHRVVFVGAPIKVDARPAVKAYLEGGTLKANTARGKNAPPSVQVLVRGHYKRQVVGVSRSGRKVIWIEPYWRGPEDAPILSRPKSLGVEPRGAKERG